MNRKQFLDKFERHLRKYKSKFDSTGIILNILDGKCPLRLCRSTCFCLTGDNPQKVIKDRVKLCKINKDWPYQSAYYENHRSSTNLQNKMIAKVDKIYKTKES
jgi:hypothetical protein